MAQINVDMESVSAEKFWESDKPMPSEVQVSTNLNIVGLNSKEDFLSIPFVVTIGYNPSVAQISLKGEARVGGEEVELDEIQGKYEENEKPPQFLIQSISKQITGGSHNDVQNLEYSPSSSLAGTPASRKIRGIGRPQLRWIKSSFLPIDRLDRSHSL